MTAQEAALTILLYVADCQRIDAEPRMAKVVEIINSVDEVQVIAPKQSEEDSPWNHGLE